MRVRLRCSLLFLAAGVACSSSDDIFPTDVDGSSGSGGDEPFAEGGGGTSLVDPCAVGTDLEAEVPLLEIAPDAIDPQARPEALPHVYATPLGPPRDRLLLFISGTDPGYLEGEQTPAGGQFYGSFLRQAAGLGFHVVGITYVNDTPINVTCGGLAPRRNCHEEVRLEVLTGEDRWPEVEVTRPDSLLERLSRLLAHLGWTQFLDGEDGIAWPRVAVAGHSQGAGHAALLGKLFAVDRALLFAGTEGAVWTDRSTETFVTPPTAYFGFNSTFDAVYPSNLRSWDNLAIPGPVTELSDDLVVPPDATHQLATTVAARDGNDHGTVVVDDAVPLTEAGTPAMRPVWCHLLTAPTGG
ncbi:MAG: hypothetical protein AAGN82_10340 [Myxococcota bacterium]